MDFNPLPQLIRRLRNKQDLSQEALGLRMGGVRQAKISNWETGKKRPTPDEERKILDGLGVPEAEVGSALVDIVTSRFEPQHKSARPQVSQPLLSTAEASLEKLLDCLEPEDYRDYEDELQMLREREGGLKRSVWHLEKRLKKKLEKAAKKLDSSDG